MTIDRLREALRAEPFRPFSIRTADGLVRRVPHPEFVYVPPRAERTIIVVDEKDGESMAILDFLLVTAIEFRSSGRGNGKNGKKKTSG